MPGHVLIAEDDIGVRAGLLGVARAAGWTTSGVATGAEALRLAREERPDVCLLDIHREGADGLAVLPDLVALEQAPAWWQSEQMVAVPKPMQQCGLLLTGSPGHGSQRMNRSSAAGKCQV